MMKSLVSVLCLLSAILTPAFTQQPVHRCGTIPDAPSPAEHYETIQELEIQKSELSLLPRAIITIPVVVHIVWQQPAENISDAQIHSQIEVLNTDFRMQNNANENIPEVFRPLATDTEIEFCLASVAPDGSPATGITRTKTDVAAIGSFFGQNTGDKIKHSELGGQDIWDGNSYLNIWVGNMGGNFLGYATFPETEAPDESGIIIDYRAFGTIGTAADNAPNHLGRTATHEIGHYLNLQHLWGAGNGHCDTDDGVEDTPNQEGPYFACPTHPQFSCFSNDMFMNYMDFTDDACMALFTEGQKARMLASLSTFRSSLLESNGCGIATSTYTLNDPRAFRVDPNPASDYVYVTMEVGTTTPIRLLLSNMNGKIIKENTLNQPGTCAFDLTDLPAGLYLLHAHDQERRVSRKIIHIRNK